MPKGNTVSIWSSIGEGLSVPARDNYTGDEWEEGDESMLDVATATSYHDCVRFTMYGQGATGPSYAQMMLDECELLRLLDLLNIARRRIQDMQRVDHVIRDEAGKPMTPHDNVGQEGHQ